MKTLRSLNYDLVTDEGGEYFEAEYEPEELTEEELREEPLLWTPREKYVMYFGYGASYVETEDVIQFDTLDTVDTPPKIRWIPPSNIKASKPLIIGQDTVDYYWRNEKCFLKKGTR